MSVRNGIFFVVVLVVLCVVCAGCVSDGSSSQNEVLPGSSLDLFSAGDGSVYMNYTDDVSGESWWVAVKSRVGSSVLSLRTPDVSVKNVVLSEEKRKILSEAFTLSGVPRVGLLYHPGRLLSDSDQGWRILSAGYAFGLLPPIRTVALTSEEWNALLPRLKEALLKITD